MWYVLAGLLQVTILLCLAWGGLKTSYSAWQLKQKQAQEKSLRAKRDLERLLLKPLFLSGQFFWLTFLTLLLCLVFTKIRSNSLEVSVLSLLSILLLNFLAKLKIIKQISQRIYQKVEVHLLKIGLFLKPLHAVLNLNSFKNFDSVASGRVESLEELMFLIENSPSVVGDTQRKLINSALNFDSVEAGEIMLPIERVVAVAIDDLLGPLAIDELHRSGEEFFPVFDHKENLLGILELAKLTSLTDKESKTAKELCQKNFISVRARDSLRSVLHSLMSNRESVAVVTDHNRPVGLIQLSAVIFKLLGAKL